jgi:type IV pilus assembly protein PilQ
VQVENGGTVVLGGIYTEEQTSTEVKVPGFGDIPVVGNLFKNRARVANKTELLIFLTPKILHDSLAAR